MQFIFPSFLWALAALAVPIIIHLFYFRKFKKVEFTNVRLLKEIKEETSSRNKLKDLLILLSRLLAITFLVLAFAQPFIPRGEDIKQGSNAVSLFIDNSYSMNAVRGQTPILDIAKQKAREIISAYDISDNFQILTHDFEGRHQRLVSKEDALSLIEEIDISPRVKILDKVIARQKQALENQGDNAISYILSDFQASIIPEEWPSDTSLDISLVPIQAIQENNISIDSVWLDAGIAFQGQSNTLLVSITNHSDEVVDNIRLALVKDGQEKPEGQLTIPARTTVIDSINLSITETGWHTAEIKITDYPVQFDDHYWVSFYVDELLNVLNIQDGLSNRYLNALINGLPDFNFNTVASTNINYGELSQNELVILHDVQAMTSGMAAALKTYVEEGGKILLFPSSNMNKESFNNFLTSLQANNFGDYKEEDKTVSQINTDEFVFNGVFEGRTRNITLPSVSGTFELTNYQNRAQESLLNFRDGKPFLVKYTRGDGILYLCTSPFDNKVNNLVLNAEIFVPMIFKMAIAKSKYEPISYVIGGNTPIELKKPKISGDLVYTLVGEAEFIPSQINLGNKLLLQENGQIEKDGIYRLVNNDSVEKIIAFNYDRLESDLTMANLANLEENYTIIDQSLNADFTTVITEKDKGIILWKWCLILALILLAIETILLRFWKK